MKISYGLIALFLLVGSSMVLTASSQDNVKLTVTVHGAAIDGPLLSDVQVTGQDAAGNNFKGTTDSKGVVVINGKPGNWKLSLTKAGYSDLDLSYDVTKSDEKEVYLRKFS